MRSVNLDQNGSCADLIGSMEGKIRVSGDIFSTGVEWNATLSPEDACEPSEFDDGIDESR